MNERVKKLDNKKGPNIVSEEEMMFGSSSILKSRIFNFRIFPCQFLD